MTELTDPRPHVFMETPTEDRGHAHGAGLLLTDFLQTYPDVDLPTIRLWQHEADGVPTLRIDARRGPLPGVDCPQCHQPVGRPHTEYCPLQLREEVFAEPVCRVCGCTNEEGCELGCWWVEADLCSNCQL